MIALVSLIGIGLCLFALRLMKPLRVYKRLEFDLIYALEVIQLIILIFIFIVALLGGK